MMNGMIFEDIVWGDGLVEDGKLVFKVVVNWIDNIYIFKCF